MNHVTFKSWLKEESGILSRFRIIHVNRIYSHRSSVQLAGERTIAIRDALLLGAYALRDVSDS